MQYSVSKGTILRGAFSYTVVDPKDSQALLGGTGEGARYR
jgi:hypothetical protein